MSAASETETKTSLKKRTPEFRLIRGTTLTSYVGTPWKADSCFLDVELETYRVAKLCDPNFWDFRGELNRVVNTRIDDLRRILQLGEESHRSAPLKHLCTNLGTFRDGLLRRLCNSYPNEPPLLPHGYGQPHIPFVSVHGRDTSNLRLTDRDHDPSNGYMPA